MVKTKDLIARSRALGEKEGHIYTCHTVVLIVITVVFVIIITSVVFRVVELCGGWWGAFFVLCLRTYFRREYSMINVTVTHNIGVSTPELMVSCMALYDSQWYGGCDSGLAFRASSWAGFLLFRSSFC